MKQHLVFLVTVTLGEGPAADGTGFQRRGADYLPGFTWRHLPLDFPKVPISAAGRLRGLSDPALCFIPRALTLVRQQGIRKMLIFLVEKSYVLQIPFLSLALVLGVGGHGRPFVAASLGREDPVSFPKRL